MQAISVFELNLQVKSILEETFLSVCVEGEISNCTHHTSGHIYFNLKDSQSTIKCVMFRGNAKDLELRLENGQKVVVLGNISVYPPRGDYQILCRQILSNRLGDLHLEYERLKKTLAQKGYFNSKKPLPSFPKSIALITSSTGATLQDMLKIANQRWKLTKFLVLNTLVQGESAKDHIASNIAYADTLGVDIIILARGGGSQEDLWAFNEEKVADAIYQAKTPIVSAIGHEIDVLISDFVADLRAPTPSAAMEMILPDQQEWLYKIADLFENLEGRFKQSIQQKQRLLEDLKERYQYARYDQKLQAKQDQVQQTRTLLNFQFANLLQSKRSLLLLPQALRTLNPLQKHQEALQHLRHLLELQNPAQKCKNGYAQLTKDGIITQLSDLQEGDCIELTDSTLSLNAKILPKL